MKRFLSPAARSDAGGGATTGPASTATHEHDVRDADGADPGDEDAAQQDSSAADESDDEEDSTAEDDDAGDSEDDNAGDSADADQTQDAPAAMTVAERDPIPDDLLEHLYQSGMSIEDVRRMNVDPALLRMITKMPPSPGGVTAAQNGQGATEPAKTAAQDAQPEAPTFALKDEELDGQRVSEGLNRVVAHASQSAKTLMEQINGLKRENSVITVLVKQLAAQAGRQVDREADQWFARQPKHRQALFGKDASASLDKKGAAWGSRVRLFKAAQSIQASAGIDLPEALDRAFASLYSEEVAKEVKARTLQEIKDAGKRTIQRPAQKTTVRRAAARRTGFGPSGRDPAV